MKKALALFFVLLTLSFGGVCAASIALSDRQDQVEVIPVSEQGDPAIAQGLEVLVRNHYDSTYWLTTYHPGENPTVSTFSHFKRYWSRESRIKDSEYYHLLREETIDLSIRDDTTTAVGYNEEEPSTGLALAYRQLAEETQPGTDGEKTIVLKDYVPFYRLSLNYYLNPEDDPDLGTTAWTNRLEERAAMEEKINQFFLIPVLEGETCSISLSKNIDGTAQGFGHGRTESDYFTFHVYDSDSVITGQEVFFVFSNRTHAGNIVDTSLIPGGYGIYRLPYTRDLDSTTGTGLLMDQLAMVYSVDPQSEILGLHASVDQSKLILRTLEDGWYVITVIDAKTMTTLQRLEAWEQPDYKYTLDFWADEEQDIFLTQRSDEEYGLFIQCENGSYALEMMCQDLPVKSWPSGSGDMVYRDGRLAVGNSDHWNTETESRGQYFELMVYDATGLRYQGQFGTTLNSKIMDNRVSTVVPVNKKPLKLTWN